MLFSTSSKFIRYNNYTSIGNATKLFNSFFSDCQLGRYLVIKFSNIRL